MYGKPSKFLRRLKKENQRPKGGTLPACPDLRSKFGELIREDEVGQAKKGTGGMPGH